MDKDIYLIYCKELIVRNIYPFTLENRSIL